MGSFDQVLVRHKADILKMPPESREQMVGTLWELGIKPKLKGLSEDDYDAAKKQFTNKYLGLPETKLPPEFGQPKVKPSAAQKIVEPARHLAEDVLPSRSFQKGFEEGTANLVSLAKYAPPNLLPTLAGKLVPSFGPEKGLDQAAAAIREHAAKVPTQAYEAAHPTAAAIGEFAGQAAPSTPLMSGIGKLIPAGEASPAASRLGKLYQLFKAEAPHHAAMWAAATTSFSDNPKDLAWQAAAGAAFGPIIGPLAARLPIIGKFLSSKPAMTKAAEEAATATTQVERGSSEALIRQVFADAHPNVSQTGSLRDLQSRVSANEWKAVLDEKDAWMRAHNESVAAEAAKEKAAAKAAKKSEATVGVVNKRADERIAKFTDKFGKPTPEQETKLRGGIDKEVKSVYAEAKVAADNEAKIEKARVFEAARLRNEEAKVARKLLGRALTPGEAERILKHGEAGADVAAKPERPAVMPKPPRAAAAPAATPGGAAPSPAVAPPASSQLPHTKTEFLADGTKVVTGGGSKDIFAMEKELINKGILDADPKSPRSRENLIRFVMDKKDEMVKAGHPAPVFEDLYRKVLIDRLSIPMEPVDAASGLTQKQQAKITEVLPHVAKAAASTEALADEIHKPSEEVPALGDGLKLRLSEAEKAKPDWHTIASSRLKEDAKSLLAKTTDDAAAQKKLLMEYDRIDKAIQEGNKEGPTPKGRPTKTAAPKQESAGTRSREAMAKTRERAKVEQAPVTRGEATPATNAVESANKFKDMFGREPSDDEQMAMDLGMSAGEAVILERQDEFEDSLAGQAWLSKTGRN